MVQLRYIGNHRPKGMIVDVEYFDVVRLIECGEFELVSKEAKIVEIQQPDETWTEMEIYDWLKSNNIPVEYKPASDKKSTILKKLKKGGYL